MDNDGLIAQLIATAQPRTSEVRVCARGDLVDQHAILVGSLADAEQNSKGSLAADPVVNEIATQIVAVEEEQEASTVTFVLQSVSRRVWADLLAEHPPRPQDKGVDHNPDTFPPAVLAACSKSPKVSAAEAVQMMDVLPVAEWTKLWLGAVGLNVTATPHPKLVAATELVRANGVSSTTAETAASLAPSSSDASANR